MAARQLTDQNSTTAYISEGKLLGTTPEGQKLDFLEHNLIEKYVTLIS